MKILLSFLLSFNLYSACEPGAVPCEEAGISNFKVQTVDPTFTASPGEKGIFNTNSQFKTKDQFGNIQRLVQDQNNLLSLGNGDVEEGLTGFAGIGTLNTTTPLQGLKSLNLDTTALNDFAETALVTIPPILMGQLCMARINIRGGDANLQMQVVNGAGTVVGSKQLDVFTDATYQFISFQCPTQALITATPNLGKLKIKLVQSTATNAALATLDDFYLGRFESNTMNVQGQVEVFRATTGALGTGNNLYWTTVRENTISDLATLINTAANGLTFTAVKPLVLNITGSNYQVGAATDVEIMLNGVLQMRQSQSLGQSDVSGELRLNAGDVVRIHTNNAVGIANESSVLITATPLPQLATIVSTNQMRAGFLGKVVNSSSCIWTRNSATMGAFAAVPGCAATISREGLAIADAVTPGQLPSITLSKLPKGRIKIESNGAFVIPGGASTNCNYDIALNGVVQGAESMHSASTAAGNATVPNRIWDFNNTTELTNVKIEIYNNWVGGAVGCLIAPDPAFKFTITVSLEPDLSSDYAIPELFAVLPPQLSSPNGRLNNYGATRVTNNGTATIATTNLNAGFLASVNRTALGVVRNTFAATFSPSEFVCFALPEQDVKPRYTNGAGFVDVTFTNSAGTGIDTNYNFQCVGI